tara:strand:+ start:3499 stop:3963 length:465 start_codon:yes stop_codon:yes gene_type:complete
MPVLVVVALAAAGWMYLENTGNSGQAGRAAHAVIDAADRVIDSARAEERYRENEEENFVTLGAIFTANGNVVATLIVRGTNGARAVCNNLAFVQDYLVGLISDYPPDRRNLSAGPVGYGGSIVAGINKLIEYDAVQRIRYDAYHLGQTGGSPNC